MLNDLSIVKVIDENKVKFYRKVNNQGREIIYARIDKLINHEEKFSNIIAEIKLSRKVIIYNTIFKVQWLSLYYRIENPFNNQITLVIENEEILITTDVLCKNNSIIGYWIIISMQRNMK